MCRIVFIRSPPRNTLHLRRIGVEEELLLIDAATGALAPVAGSLVDAWETSAGPAGSPGPVGAMTSELKQEQVELVSAPFAEAQSLLGALVRGRLDADRLAGALGARTVALGTYPLRSSSSLVQSARYLAMSGRYGITLKEQLTCGFHIHVSVESEEEAVAVIDRIRIWLPLLLALGANSPYWQGADSGYSSYRYQVWRRWPTAGPTDIFSSAAAYRAHVETLLHCEVLLDPAMVYFDARVSAAHPTVEIRVADVCLDAEDAAAIAALVRALVETAARQWAAGHPAPSCPTEVLRLASWKASSAGVHGPLLHPLENRPCGYAEAVAALLVHARAALEDYGDLDLVREALKRIGMAGTGADAQRRSLRRSGNLREVLFDAVQRTHLYSLSEFAAEAQPAAGEPDTPLNGAGQGP